ncbi:MAG: UDP-3-O-[3-hydroxymyristoyl] N-acetylglucosamine deacetylase [Planctomycetes bacterium RBG_16_64_12]|nr:MAG: UDP-3-O-[3-hydroxymyristoyl] N-acetylglucosamine deacetylase [Planctomycetes bacterium RBG_16_64_12]
MDSTRNQRTIAGPALVEGFGYWDGKDVRVQFRPADVNTGIVFVRSDLAGCPRIPAHVCYRVEQPRRISLRRDGAGVEMIEHVMAALAGLWIDNCEIWVDRHEMPGCDGSALPFVRALDAAGIVEQDAPKQKRIVREVIRLGDGESWFDARPSRSGEMVLKYYLDYGPEGPIGRQTFRISPTPESFRTELAPCRTFLLKSDADRLLARGLGRRATCQDLLVFGDDGPIGNRLRFPDECVRHKILDMLGDLALAGCDLVGRFSAYKSGHRLNAEMVRALTSQSGRVGLWRRCA